jgi:ParB family chromosome partitioning protein
MYLDLSPALIDANPDQPRKHFDAEKLQELADSIGSMGLVQPITVRPHGDRYLIVAGERRWRASQIAGLETVPVRVMDLAEVDAYVLSVAENVNRDDMTIMEEARAYDQLRRYGKPLEEIASIFGKRQSTVRERLALVDLGDRIVALIDEGVIGPVLGYKLSFLEPGNQRVVAHRLSRGEISHGEACALADAMYDAQGEVGFFDVEEPTEEERIQHQRTARQTKSAIEQIERLSALLGDLAASDPAALATALGADTGARLRSVERIARQANTAAGVLRKAEAIAQARTLLVRDEAKA